MITCDQVVSGGSAERTTKMAAAPAADSRLVSLPSFSTLSSHHSRQTLSFSFSVFLSLSSSPDYSEFCLSLPILLRVFCLGLSHPYHVLRPAPKEDSDAGERIAGRGVNRASQDQVMLISSHISLIIVDH